MSVGRRCPTVVAVIIAVVVIGYNSAVCSNAFQQQQRPTARLHLPSLRATVQQQDNKDAMRQDIEAMKKEALQRLEALTGQMEELKHCKEEQQQLQQQQQQQVTAAASAAANSKQPHQASYLDSSHSDTHSLDSLEGDMTKTQRDDEHAERATQQPPQFVVDGLEKAAAAAAPASKEHEQQQQQQRPSETASSSSSSLELLDDTRWKIVFNIGREKGTWMPKSWGASGERLLFTVIGQFTSQPVPQERDEFFQGSIGTKLFKVEQAWMIPTGTGRASVGRRDIAVKPEGAYRVVQGEGPVGTDIVRLYIDVERDVRHEIHDDQGRVVVVSQQQQQKSNSAADDIYCPSGRVYGTCGYFPILPSVSPVTGKKHVLQKDVLAKEHQEAVLALEQLQREQRDASEKDDKNGGFGGAFSWEGVGRMRKIMDARKRVETIVSQIQMARQREPERSQLRLSPRGNVGLTKEGGVCCKVRKGLALEYHILGRMELGPLHDTDDEMKHDQFEDLVHKLHP